MKFLTRLLMIAISSILLFSCAKEKEEPIIITGFWQGKIGEGTNPPSGQYAVQIYPDGKIERINSNGTATAEGTWTLEGKKFTASYQFKNGNTQVTIDGQYNRSSKKLSGNWSNNGGEQGTFTLSR